jgi:hypothetical protein
VFLECMPLLAHLELFYQPVGLSDAARTSL